jgi:hypothetical protein
VTWLEKCKLLGELGHVTFEMEPEFPYLKGGRHYQATIQMHGEKEADRQAGYYGRYGFPLWTVRVHGVYVCDPAGRREELFGKSGTPSQAINRAWSMATAYYGSGAKLRRWLEKEGQAEPVYRWTNARYSRAKNKMLNPGWMPHMRGDIAKPRKTKQSA